MCENGYAFPATVTVSSSYVFSLHRVLSYGNCLASTYSLLHNLRLQKRDSDQEDIRWLPTAIPTCTEESEVWAPL